MATKAVVRKDQQTIVAPTDAELLKAQADLWRHSLYYLTSTALKCAVELGIPTAIHNLGGVATVEDLVAALSLPANKAPYLRRLMRLLVVSGIFTLPDDTNSTVLDATKYRLNPLSWLLVDGVDAEDHTNQKYLVLAVACKQYVDASLTLASWFKKNLASPLPSPFEDTHGVPLLHEKTAQFDEELDAMVREAKAAHDNLAMGTVIRECGEVFEGLQSLTDCSGDDGSTAAAIRKAYPHLKCNVLEQPQVVDTAPAHEAVAAELFQSVPPAQAVLLKLVLHFWSDDDCVKILEQCRKAIPPREEGGKVIIIEIVLSPSMEPTMLEAQLLLDMAMMVNVRGRQRDEADFREIFQKAGFSDYKIVKKIGIRSVTEVYP